MKTEKKQHLKGSVLFTVVSVMSLLVIFLMGTLVLATSASNRSHKNYSTSQAEYTARAAIESFSQAMSRNAAIAQTVVDMGKTDTLEPTVVIEDAGMGSVGFYDAAGEWVDDKIQIEYIDDTYVYAEDKWEAQQVLRVTATAKVGKEESTVSAYIRKKAPNEPDPLTIKGFQTLGGGGYTATAGYISGAISMGLKEDGTQTYDLKNESVYETDMFFINGGLKVEGADITINAYKTGTGSVIMGDLTTQNDFVINVDYPYAERGNSTEAWQYAELTHKNIPYLYVDGSLNVTNHFSVKTGADTATSLTNGAPYNIFCGTFNQTANNISMAADVYIMGDSGTSMIGHTDAAGSKLVAWSTSIANKTNTQFYSEGGNIYCNENLQLGHINIKGDVRVKGNLKLYPGVRISGDLVVDGAIDLSSANGETLANIVSGTVYNGDTNMTVSGMKEGVFFRNNVYNSHNIRPGFTRVRNVEFPNIAVENVQYANYAEGGQATGIEQVTNIPFAEYVPAEGEAPPVATVVSVYKGLNGIWDKWVYADTTPVGDEINLSDFADQNSELYKKHVYWNGSANQLDVCIINGTANFIDPKIGGPYVCPKNGEVVLTDTSYFVNYVDGSFTSVIPTDIVVYKADKDGNKTDEVVYQPGMAIQIVDEYGLLTAEGKNIFRVIYRVDPEGNITDEVWPEEYTYYKPDASGNATTTPTTLRSFFYKADATGNATDVETDTEFTYYDLMNNVETDEATAMGDDFYTAWYSDLHLATEEVYYYSADPSETDGMLDAEKLAWHNIHNISKAEAFEEGEVRTIESFTGAGHEVYPSSMTRGALLGDVSKGDTFAGKYKVVTTLEDVQASIGYSSEHGFDSNTYFKEVPGVVYNPGTNTYDGFEKINISTGNNNRTFDINGNAHITGTAGPGEVTININPDGADIWVVLDNANFGGAKAHKIIVSGNGTVNFMIKGALYMNGNAGIFTKTIYDQIEDGGTVIVREDDKININYYGSEGSTITMDNQNIMCGIAKCPYTNITTGSQSYQHQFTYIDKLGNSTTYTGINWVGNALFNEMTSGGNNFRLLYTGSSASNDPIYNELLKESWQVMYYDVY